MRRALIDCGTNTFHLLVGETAEGGQVRILHRETVPVKLGEGGLLRKVIAPAAFRRGLSVLAAFAEEIERWRPGRVTAYGTAALRRAENGVAFVAEAKRRTGISIEVISGRREAELICLGVRQAVTDLHEPALIMDIGGGSLELVLADRRSVLSAGSFPLGATLLLQKFRPSDPVRPGEVDEITRHLAETMDPFLAELEPSGGPSRLIGSAGSFDTFAALIEWRLHRRDVSAGTRMMDLDLPAFRELHETLLKSVAAERSLMHGMHPMRVELIVVGSILANFVVRRLPIRRLTWSAWSLKEGMLYAALNPGSP